MINLKENLEASLEYFFRNNCQCIEKECKVRMTTSETREKLKLLDRLEGVKGLLEKNCNIVSLRHTTVTTEELESSSDNILKEYTSLNETFKLERILSQLFILLNTYPKSLFTRGSFSWGNISEISERDVESLYYSNKRDMDELYEIFTGESSVEFKVMVDIIKVLFWYYRKSFVDNLIRDIIGVYYLDLIVYSVGSTSLGSDYDLTLYGDYNHIAYCIRIFNNTFKWFFNDTSSNVFDTNLYGAAFITFDLNKLGVDLYPSPVSTKSLTSLESTPVQSIFREESCNGVDMYILDDPRGEIVGDQHIWLFIKMFSNFGTQSEITRGLELSVSYIGAARSIWPLLNQIKNRVAYSTVVNRMELYKNELRKLSNMISLVNFMGNETYYTRGAFLSVVVNTQLCKGAGLKLDDATMVDSFCENLFDFLFYHKLKYLDRARVVLEEMSEDFLELRNDVYKIYDIIDLCKTNCDYTLVRPLVISLVGGAFRVLYRERRPKLDLRGFKFLNDIKTGISSLYELEERPFDILRKRTSTFSGLIPKLPTLPSKVSSREVSIDDTKSELSVDSEYSKLSSIVESE